MLVAQLGTVCDPESSSAVWFGPLVKLGGSLTGVTVMVKVCGALVSPPPFAVSPLPWATPVMVALFPYSTLFRSVRVPFEEIAGAVLNRLGLVLPVTMKL